MSSGTATPPLPVAEVPVMPLNECEVVIDQRLRKTQRHVKGVDIAEGLVTLAVGILAYLLATAMIDHWLVEGGLGFAGRFWLWAALVGIAGVYFARRVLPPLVRRINPLFAAATIEHSQPTLKNSLINFLLLRGHKRELAMPVYQAMERRAADDLNHVEIDVVVDRSHVIRMGVALAIVLAVFSLYLVISPKNPIRSAARVLLPWSNIAAPTRVMILDVQPGNAAAFHGESVIVSAEITGLNEADAPQLIYSTADGQTVDQSIPLTQSEGEYRHQCQLPPGKLGMQQDIIYYLAAGDCRTERYRVNVQVAPAIVVDSVAYHYPPYTGISDQTVDRQGDLRAIEGTEITIKATANTDIKPGSAEIDLGCTGRQGLRMSVDGRTATGRFTLRLNPKDPALAEYDAYQIRFADLQGRENQPIRHRIDVIRDLPPDNVQIVEPKKDDVQVAVRGKLAIKVQAEDPDFGLRTVAVRAQREERSLLIPPLLDRPKPELAWTGKFTGTYVFEPGRLGLKAGDRVEYWVEADDNREPMPGRTLSNRQWITVVDAKADKQADRGEAEEQSPAAKDESEKPKDETRDQSQKSDSPKEGDKNDANEKPAENAPDDKQPPGEKKPDQPQEQQDQQQPSESSKGDKSSDSKAGQGDNKQGSDSTGQDKGQQSGDQQSGDKQQKSQGGDNSNERVDPDTAPGDAMQEILNDRQKEQQQNKQQGKDSTKGDQANDQNQPSEENGQKPGEKQEGEQKQPSGDQQQPGKKGDGGKNAGKDGAGEAGEQKPGEDQSGDKNAEGKKGEGKKAGKDQPGGKSSDQKDAGDKQDGGKPSDKQNADDKKAGSKQGGAQGKEGEKTGGKGQKGDKQKAPGEEGKAEKSEGAEPGEEKQEGGEKKEGQQGQPQSDNQSTPGAGKKTDNRSGGTTPQDENKDRAKKPDHAADAPGEGQGEKQESPGTSSKQSDSQGETEGDRSGGGEAGGGQQSNKKGVGGAGSHKPADEGGSKADEQGEGETGAKAGDQTASKKPTGSAAKQSSENGTGTGQKPDGKAEGGKPSDSSDQGQGTPQDKTSEGGKAGKNTSEGPGTRGSGPPTGGGKPGEQTGEATPPEPADNLADEASLDYSRRQTELALEHLRDQLAKEKPELLEKLGWTKDDARRFLERWEQMRASAGEKGANSEVARKRFEDALRSLGLRPRGAELKHGGVTTDKPQQQRDASRFVPPPDWAEQFREYTKGVAGEQRGK